VEVAAVVVVVAAAARHLQRHRARCDAQPRRERRIWMQRLARRAGIGNEGA